VLVRIAIEISGGYRLSRSFGNRIDRASSYLLTMIRLLACIYTQKSLICVLQKRPVLSNSEFFDSVIDKISLQYSSTCGNIYKSRYDN